MTDPANPGPGPGRAARGWSWDHLLTRFRSTEGIGFIVGVFIASRVLVLLIAVVGPYLVPPGPFSPGLAATTTWSDYWVRWDGGWYIDIAQHGYRFNGAGNDNVAFFPLFPLLLRGAGWLGLNAAAAGIVISNGCLLAGLWVLYRLVRDEFGRPRLAELAVSLMAFGPAALWCSIGYTEALYFALTVALCRALWTRRLAWAVLWGVLAGLTRSNAITLALPALVLAWPLARAAWPGREWRRLPLLGLAVFSPWIGYLLYAGYLQVAFGTWRANQISSLAWWGAQVSFAPETLTAKMPGSGLRLFWSLDAFDEYVAWSWFLALVVSAFALIALWEARAPRWHAAFLLGFWGFFIFANQYGGPLSSMARFTSLAFPLYVAGALFAERRPWAQSGLLAASVVGMTLTTLFFFAGYHIN